MMGSRTFRARITPGQYAFLLLSAFLAAYGLWNKGWGAALAFMLLSVLAIEQLIHTTYTVTADGQLFICRGRFRPLKRIALADIRQVERARPKMLARIAVSHSILLHLANGRIEALLPANEADFLTALGKRGCPLASPESQAKEQV